MAAGGPFALAAALLACYLVATTRGLPLEPDGTTLRDASSLAAHLSHDTSALDFSSGDDNDLELAGESTLFEPALIATAVQNAVGALENAEIALASLKGARNRTLPIPARLERAMDAADALEDLSAFLPAPKKGRAAKLAAAATAAALLPEVRPPSLQRVGDSEHIREASEEEEEHEEPQRRGEEEQQQQHEETDEDVEANVPGQHMDAASGAASSADEREDDEDDDHPADYAGAFSVFLEKGHEQGRAA